MDVMSPPAVGVGRTVQSTRLAEIEVLRAIAVLMVLVQHVAGNLVFWHSYTDDTFINNGGFFTGVDLFFAISGFVIARTFLPRLAGVTGWSGFFLVAIPFWIARAWRLLPSAWFWLTAPLILCLVFNRSGVYGSFKDNWAVFVAGMLYMQNFHLIESLRNFGSGTAFVQWSLSLEEQFYLLLPFAAFYFKRSLVFPLLFIAIAGFFVPNSVFTLLTRLWPIAFGVLLAMWSTHITYQECAPTGLAKSRAARIGLLCLLLVCLVSIGTSSLHVVSRYQGPVALIAVILVWLASYDRGFLWEEGWPRRVMTVIAARSYSLYLAHIPVYFAAHEIWFRLHGNAVPGHHRGATYLVLTMAAVFAAAEANHRFLEKPLREHGKYFAARYRARRTLVQA